MITYLLSNTDDSFDSLLSQHFKNDIIKTNKIVYVPTDYNDIEKTAMYADRYNRYFKDINLDFKSKVILSKDMSTVELSNHLRSTDVIFLMGGNTLNQFQFLKTRELIDTIKNSSAVVIGISAGAINLCNTSLLINEHPTENVYIYEGIARVGISIEVHFEIDNKEQIDLLEEANNKLDKIYCITDFSSIRIENDSLHTIGDDVYIFETMKINKI